MLRASLLTALLAITGWQADAQTRMAPDDFLDIAVGHTLTFQHIASGKIVGTEQFINRTLNVWKQSGRTCIYGKITIDDGKICFDYESLDHPPPNCWWVFQDNDKFYVRKAEGMGGEIQEIINMSTSRVDCPQAPIS